MGVAEKTQCRENTTGRSAGEESGLDAELWTSTAPPAQIFRENKEVGFITRKAGFCLVDWDGSVYKGTKLSQPPL